MEINVPNHVIDDGQDEKVTWGELRDDDGHHHEDRGKQSKEE